MIDDRYDTVAARPCRKLNAPSLRLPPTLQICNNEIDQLGRRVQRARNEAKHAKRPQHQSHIDSTRSEAINKSPIKVREPEKPLPILSGNHLRKRVKSRPLLRRKEPKRHQHTPAPEASDPSPNAPEPISPPFLPNYYRYPG